MTDVQPIDLRVENLTKSFYGVRAIDAVNFHLAGGEVHGLLGENGAGKSTLCSVLSGLYRPDQGKITLRGKPVQLRSPHEASQHGIGMVYQHFRLVESFTVAQNIALGLGKKFGGRSIRHIESRVADGAVNIHSGMAAVLTAARLGVVNGLSAPPAETGDGFEDVNTDVCVAANLSEALDQLEADTAFSAALGQDLVDNFVANKRAEWERYIEVEGSFDGEAPPTAWELNEYMMYH